LLSAGSIYTGYEQEKAMIIVY